MKDPQRNIAHVQLFIQPHCWLFTVSTLCHWVTANPNGTSPCCCSKTLRWKNIVFVFPVKPHVLLLYHGTVTIGENLQITSGYTHAQGLYKCYAQMNWGHILHWCQTISDSFQVTTLFQPFQSSILPSILSPPFSYSHKTTPPFSHFLFSTPSFSFLSPRQPKTPINTKTRLTCINPPGRYLKHQPVWQMLATEV